jgi:DNA-binding CsgD family transcriptional regulator
MITFTLMVASAGLSYVVYSRNRAIWLRDYLSYAFLYALWLLFATWVHFQQAYLPEPMPQLTVLFAWVRAVISLPIFYVGPLFFIQAAGIPRSRTVRLAMLGVVVALTLLVVAFLRFQLPLLARAVTLASNMGFAWVATFATLRLRRRSANPARPMFPVVAYSMVAYLALAVLSVVLPFVVPSPLGVQLNVIATGAFLFVWAIVAIIVHLRWIGGHEQAREPIPAAFVSDYTISPREAEILRVLVTGKTSGEIGEELFISQRTVEAHLYRIYRKCNVSNRVELLNRIAEYRA